MKRPRPHVPIAVRVEVAERDVLKGPWWPLYERCVNLSLGRRLSILLGHFPKGTQLDHDPALILRKFDEDTGLYTPDANDPACLTYREPREHLQKTIGRKADAEKTVTTKGSDIWLKSKFNRLEGRTKQRTKAKIPSKPNPWPKRPFPKRSAP
jgi:hypothetical protein